MSKVTEIELRGPVSASVVDSLKNNLHELGILKEKKARVLIDYTTFLEGETIKDRTIDIRIRNTNGTSEVIVKTGKWGGSDVRDEFKIRTTDSFDSLTKIMSLLGYKKGMLCVRNSEVFQLGEVEIAIVEVPGHSFYFEAEIETEKETEIESLKKNILDTLGELNLQTFTDDEFYSYIEELNEHANTIFDSNLAPPNLFEKKFNI